LKNISLVKQQPTVELRNFDNNERKAYSILSFGAATDTVSLQSTAPAKKQEGISKLNALIVGVGTGLATYGINRWRTPKEESPQLVKDLEADNPAKLLEELKSDNAKLTSFIDDLSKKIQKLTPEQYVNIQLKKGEQFKMSFITAENSKINYEGLAKQIESGALDDVIKTLIMLEENAASLSEEQITQKIAEAKKQQIIAIREGSTSEALKELAEIFSPEGDAEFIKTLGSKEHRDMMLKTIKENFDKVIKQDIELLKHKPIEYLVELNQMISNELPVKASEVGIKASKTVMKGWKAALIGFAVGTLGYVGAKMTVLKPKTESVNPK
jgi:hypothetical protein